MALARKPEIRDILIEGCRDAGWGVLVLGDQHPFLLHLYRGEEKYRVRVYAWNLTHGGGKARPVDEYRIQVTGIDTATGFVQDGADKVVILGWWAGAEVFAGFDYAKHTGRLGHSPSIQIREEALRRASLQGIATQDKGNGEIAVAFRPDMFPTYVRYLEQIHSFGESAIDRTALERVADEPDNVIDIVQEVSAERKTVVLSIAQKLRNHSFKERVLTAYGNRCAFCDLQLKLVDAAHIVPVSEEGSDATSNGIALCALHHRAFDRALVTLNEDYQVLVNENRIDDLRALGLDSGAHRFRQNLRTVIRVPPARRDRPAPEHIATANRLRGWDLK